jgi:hypothetical protein
MFFPRWNAGWFYTLSPAFGPKPVPADSVFVSLKNHLNYLA